ncbi:MULTISPECIES: beta-ketoacyl-[acyl-carrier-protein] synthase family protein [unclassified Streptomyces]|uniref:beta-ketoacyl-[acyl-carrier-protein] synthase family protein n=1 Tax=Streptomyces sp. NPDC127532 TaxID=3345399 RepID=UPI00362BA2DD
MRKNASPAAVITGIGAQLAGVSGVSDFWEALRSASPGVRRLRERKYEGLASPLGASVRRRRPVDLLPGLEPHFAHSYGDDILLTMAAAEQSRRDATLAAEQIDPQRIGVIASSSRGPLQWWADQQDGAGAASGRAAALVSLPGAPASLYAVYADLRGPVATLSSACVGGHQAVGWAADLLAAGVVDAMIVVGHEFPLVPDLMRAYEALGVLSGQVDRPGEALRPYSSGRDGFVLGEGAVALLLERPRDAWRRGAESYATVLGHRSENEAAHATRMDSSGRSMAGLIQRLFDETEFSAEDLSYVCGHASATGLNDVAECRCLSLLFDGRARSSRPPLGGNKPVFGHTLGASGVINTAACALMIRHQELAPTRIVGTVDPECDHDHVAEGPRRTRVRSALSLSFALGSQSSALLLGEPS